MKITFCLFQDKYKCTVYALAYAKLINQLAYTMYRVYMLYKQTPVLEESRTLSFLKFNFMC